MTRQTSVTRLSRKNSSLLQLKNSRFPQLIRVGMHLETASPFPFMRTLPTTAFRQATRLQSFQKLQTHQRPSLTV